ncbi:MAG: ParB/RepB/Spo0J family partition protein [candidate division WOR-3 bacterium]
MVRRALGKGFDALIPKIEEDKVPIDQIIHSPLQPRKKINDEELEGLVASIKQNGILQPVLLRRLEDGKYELVYGHRRFEAAKRAGLKEIPAVFRKLSDREVLELAIIENIQREDLTPLEEAWAYYRLNVEFNLTQEEIAERVGKARTTITNKMRLLSLPEEVKEALNLGKITEGHARALLGFGDDKKRILKELEKIIRGEKTVREVEKASKGKLKREKIPLEYEELQEELMHFFNSEVRIKLGKKKGQLIIEFYSNKDLERIVGLIKGK